MAYRLRLWNLNVSLAGMLALTVLGWAFSGLVGQAVGISGLHVTECGFDSKGAYAKVRVSNLLGGAHEQDVAVDFHLNGENRAYSGYGSGYSGIDEYVQVPAHGRSVIVLHTGFPDRKVAKHQHVEGPTVYVFDSTSAHPTFVTKEFAARHPFRTNVETVPNDPNSLHCKAYDGDPT